ncbi:MarR family winged helix-turn-helix transcriptional regulator [Pigmentiphaga sp.]|uniref:MarR family winged helix-turn-helix transcriptional regulator n=1 Tax=Pigmentiphaga sp. TaxID=1977564 RepID=UPI0025E28CDF|nr:MarR family transcriptional regulator [Pigmentiphaga sp.]MBX6317117.1 MarR family transcriptional regulator [Pigmentiphaga sp.]
MSSSSSTSARHLSDEVRNYDPNDSVGYLVKLAHGSLQRAVDTEMMALDLTAMQWGPLMLLAMGQGETAAELARSSCTDTGAVTRMLDRLESKGLIRRVRSAEDRRVIKLELTQEGMRATAQIPGRLRQAVDMHTRGFSEEELAQLKSFLRRMIANGAHPG